MLDDIKTVLNMYLDDTKPDCIDLKKFNANQHLMEFSELLQAMIQYPNLIEVQFGDCSFTREQRQQLLSALSHSPNFKMIGFNGCNLDMNETQAVMNTLSDLDLFPALNEVRISRNTIDVLSAKAIADMIIARGEQFKRMSLQGCKLSDASLAEIACALKSVNCRVELLDIRGSSFTQTGLMTLVRIIEESSFIKYLSISDNLAFNPQTRVAFLNAIRKSSSLIQVEISSNGISIVDLRRALLANPADKPLQLLIDYERTVTGYVAKPSDDEKLDLHCKKDCESPESQGCTIC